MSEAATTEAAPATTTEDTSATTAPAGESTTLLDGAASTTEQTAEPAEAGGEAAQPERAAPEKYEFKLPEGVAIDSEILGEFEGVARDLKMPQAEAQAVIERLTPKIAERVAKQQADAVARLSDEWSTASKADKEFGGEKLAENLAVGEGALKAFGTPELAQLLKESRLGNHPEFIRFCVRAGKALSPDTVVVGRQAAPEKTTAQKLYPSMEK